MNFIEFVHYTSMMFSEVLPYLLRLAAPLINSSIVQLPKGKVSTEQANVDSFI